MSAETGSYSERFSTYFAREVAQKAAHSLSNGVEMEFRIQGSDGKTAEEFTFTKAGGKNQINSGKASSPQLIFTLTQQAADQILADTSDDIGAIGVNIAKLILSPNANARVNIKFEAGFLSLFSKGYFGVITAGGTAFASYLASKGLNGVSAIKAVLSKKKG